MATGQTLLNWMEILFPELQLQTGEGDVTKGLLALNAAQDMLETHIAQYGSGMFGGGVSSLTTTAAQEHTTYPSGVLRIDAIDILDANGVVEYRLTSPTEAGGHAFNKPWPWNVLIPTSTGKPTRFWTNGTRVYWDPLPDAVYTFRVYGFSAASDITASGTFAYPDIAILPVATLACKFIRVGLDDPIDNYSSLAQETFNPVLDAMDGFNRTGPSAYVYTRSHDT